MYKKIFFLTVIYFGLIFSNLFILPTKVQAAGNCSQAGIELISGDIGDDVSFEEDSISSVSVTLNMENAPNGEYALRVYDTTFLTDPTIIGGSASFNLSEQNYKVPQDIIITTDGATIKDAFSIGVQSEVFSNDPKYVYVYYKGPDDYLTSRVCLLGHYTITNSAPSCSQRITISQVRKIGTSDQTCYASLNSCIDATKDVTIAASGLKDAKGNDFEGRVTIIASNGTYDVNTSSPGKLSLTTTLPANDNFSLKLKDFLGNEFKGPCNPTEFAVENVCRAEDSCEQDAPINSITTQQTPFLLCQQITNEELRGKCTQCAEGEEGRAGVWTAVGCIKREPTEIVKRFVQIGLGAGGGICLLMCLAAGFMLSTSQGDPKQVNEAREMITSAVIGLLFIIFSVVILQFIGVTILNIPGFGTTK